MDIDESIELLYKRKTSIINSCYLSIIYSPLEMYTNGTCDMTQQLRALAALLELFVLRISYMSTIFMSFPVEGT